MFRTVWGTSVLIWVPKLWLPKNDFQVFFFQLYFNKKYFEVAKHFTMHLIIWKWLPRQKCRQKRKTMQQKEDKEKEKTVHESVLIHLNM